MGIMKAKMMEEQEKEAKALECRCKVNKDGEVDKLCPVCQAEFDRQMDKDD